MLKDNWEDSRDDLQFNVLPVLKQHGQRIGLSATQGNQIAKDIIKYYSMLQRSFDPMSVELLKVALKDFGLLGGKNA